MAPVSFLPSTVYEEAKLNQMQGKAGRVVTSWNQFARNLKEAFYLYKDEKQSEFFNSLDRTQRFLVKALPLRKVLIALLPYLMYLLVYTNYKPIRSLTGLDESRKPNITFLPWLEYTIFRFFPHRFLSQYARPLFDMIAAVPYLVHFPLPVLYIVYLLSHPRRRNHLFPFMWCAGWVNLIAVFIQFVFPTAPPWYVDSAVYDNSGNFITSAANEAGFHRLDALIGYRFFHKIYSASPLKFGAFPSLHVAWPAIIVINQPWINRKFAWLHVSWIIWAAMYSNHHYGVDAIGAIILVAIVNFSMNKVWSPFHSSSRVFRLLQFNELKDTRTM